MFKKEKKDQHIYDLQGKVGKKKSMDFSFLRNRIFIAVVAFFVGAFALAGNSSTDADTQKQLEAKDTEISKLKEQVEKLEKTEEIKTEETANTKEGEKDYDFSKIKPTDQQDAFLKVALQNAIRDNGYKDDTAPVMGGWAVNGVNYKDDKRETKRWTVVTESKTNGRVKLIIDWSGNEKDYEYKIRHLLVGGNAIIDDLN